MPSPEELDRMRDAMSSDMEHVAAASQAKMTEGSLPPAKYELTPQMKARLENDFTYHPPKPDQQPRYVALRGEAKKLTHLICQYVPPGREQSLALTKLEEAIMHANAGISREP